MTRDRARFEILNDLRQRIAHLEHPALGREYNRPLALSLGVEAIDRHLPWGGLASAALHEIIPASRHTLTSAYGFSAALLGLAARRGPVLWCQSNKALGEELYAPGLENFGLFPSNLIMVNLVKDQELLWAMEEALRSRALAAVLGEVCTLSQVPVRRLQLAAESSATIAFLLRNSPNVETTTSAMTRWQVGAVSTYPLSFWSDVARWLVKLQRCRNGSSGTWLVEWKNENLKDPEIREKTSGFRLVATLRDRPLCPSKNSVSRHFTPRPSRSSSIKTG